MAYTKTNWNDNTAPYINATNLNKIENGIKNNDTAIGNLSGEIEDVLGYDEYSNSSTYAVGDYCIYNNKLYVCNTAIATAEEFNSTHWNETSVDGIINGVKGDVATNTSNISANTSSINTINTKIGALRVYYSGWSTSITFTLPAGHIAILMASHSAMYQLWNPNDQLDTTAILGTGISFSRASDKVTITASRNGSATWTVLVF